MNKNISTLFGKIEEGKSSFINAFFGKEKAKTSNDTKIYTSEITTIEDYYDNEKYTFIDTPGLNDIKIYINQKIWK